MTDMHGPLGYLGVKAPTPPNLIKAQRAPTVNDWKYDVGTIWIDEVGLSTFELINVAGLHLANWQALGGGAVQVDSLVADTGIHAIPAAGDVTIAGGRNLTTTAAGSTLTVAVDTGTAAVPKHTFTADNNIFQIDGVTTGGVAGTTYRALTSYLGVDIGNGTSSPEATDSFLEILPVANISNAYGISATVLQDDGSHIVNDAIASSSDAEIAEVTPADQPQHFIAGSESIVSFAVAAGVPTATLVSASIDTVQYNPQLNLLANGHTVTRAGGVGGTAAAAAYKVLAGGAIADWAYGLDLFTGGVGAAALYATSDIRLANSTRITSLNASDVAITMAANGTLGVQLGDSLGATALQIINTGAAVRSSISSLGDIAGRNINTTNTNILSFNANPVLESALDTGAAPSGATGDTNIMMMQQSEIMEQFILGAGQTIIAPRMDAAGLKVSLDLTVAEGAEYNFGVLPVSKHAYTVGTSPAVSFQLRFTVADVTGAGPILMGFRKQEANNAAFAAYTDFATIGLDNAINPGTAIIETRLNSGAVTTTNTTNAWVDGATHTLKVSVSAAGVVTFSVDGAAPVVTQAFTFDNGDIIMPFFHFLHAAAAPGEIHWTSMAAGLQ